MNSRSPKSEHNHQTSFLTPRYLESLDQRHRQEEDNNVLSNIDSGVRKPHDLAVHASHTLHGLFPESLDWTAQEDVAKHSPNAVHDHDEKDGIAHFLEAAHRKNPQVLDEDRDLGEQECEAVYPECCPESLVCKLAS